MFAKLLTVTAVVGAAGSQSVSATTEATALLQSTAAVLVDSDADLELVKSDGDAVLEFDVSDLNDGEAQQSGAVVAGSEVATSFMVGRLNRTLNDADCLAEANAKCFEGLGQLSHTVGNCLDHLADFADGASLLQMMPGFDDLTASAKALSKEFHKSGDEMFEDQGLFKHMTEVDDLDANMLDLTTLVVNLGQLATKEQGLFGEAYKQCMKLPGTSKLTFLCKPFQNWFSEMGGHVDRSKSDLLILQTLHGAVKAAPGLALLQNKQATSITQSDALSTDAISTLMQLAKAQLKIQEQVRDECKTFGDLAEQTLSAAQLIPGVASACLLNTDQWVNEIISAGATQCR